MQQLSRFAPWALWLAACLDLQALQAGRYQQGESPPSDASTGPPPVPDASMPAADMAAPLASGCRDSVGTHQGDNVWTCPGAWSSGSPDLRCAATHQACSVGFRNIDACRAIQGGTFIGRRLWSQDKQIPPLDSMTGTTSWGPDDGNTRYRALFYCGPTAGPDTYVTPAASVFFQQIVVCDKQAATSKAFACPWATGANTDFDLVTNSVAGNGVLCCPR